VLQIVDAADDVPVLVAGGVATARHVAAGLDMGAAGFGSAPLGFYQRNIKRIYTLLIRSSLKRQKAGILRSQVKPLDKLGLLGARNGSQRMLPNH